MEAGGVVMMTDFIATGRLMAINANNIYKLKRGGVSYFSSPSLGTPLVEQMNNHLVRQHKDCGVC